MPVFKASDWLEREVSLSNYLVLHNSLLQKMVHFPGIWSKISLQFDKISHHFFMYFLILLTKISLQWQNFLGMRFPDSTLFPGMVTLFKFEKFINIRNPLLSNYTPFRYSNFFHEFWMKIIQILPLLFISKGNFISQYGIPHAISMKY